MKKEFFLQSLLIFLSVFLGLMASNWNEGRKEKAKTKHFLENLVQELESNKKLIAEAIPYHTQLGETSDSLFNNASEEVLLKPLISTGGLGSFPGWRGLGINTLDNSVYQSGLMSGVFERIPIDLLSKISRIQSYHEEYERFSRNLSEKLLNFGAETSLMEVSIIASLIGHDLKGMEKGLVYAFNQVIEEIENQM